MTSRPDPIDQLFARPPAEFTAARNALAKQLKAAGQAAEAREVAALRKPTQLVHAVNQLARSHSQELAAALAAGARLKAAHEAALAGSGGEALHEAVRAMREAILPLVDAAEAGLGREGAPLRHRVAEMVKAAATGTERERERLARGRCEVEPEPEASFGDPDLVRLPRAPAAPSPVKATADPATADRAAADRATADRAAADRAAADRAAADRAAAEATRAQAAREAAAARQTLDRAREEAARAEARLVEAQRDAEAARQRVRDAEAAVRRR